MKILIIENVWMGRAKYGVFDKTLLTMFSILPTLYARQIAAITPKKHSVEVINERYKKINFEKPYDLVNINFTTSTAQRAYDIADKFKENGIPVILSGLHPSLMPDEAKQHANGVLLGRGELNWVNLLNDFEKNKLKTFYYPLKYDKNIKLPQTKIDLPGLVLTGAVEATRGCPYKCEFCRETNIPGGSQFYARPIDEVIEEIKSMPQKAFTFYDASLTIDSTYTKSLFLKMKNINKKFSCNGNVDVLAQDKELIKISKEAGCVSWLIGFESISQNALEEIGKKTNRVKDYEKAVENIHNNGMIVIGCFIFGFDSDDKNVFKDTLKIIKKLNIDVADFLILTPFPGTPLYDKLEKQGRILTKDWSKYNMKKVVFTPKNMSSDELINGVRYLYKDFYSYKYTIKRVIRILKFGIYPFLLILERNFTAYMNSRKFLK